MKVASSHLLLPVKHFPRLSLLIVLLLFLYMWRKRNFRREGPTLPSPKKDISWPPIHTALLTGPLAFLGDLANKKLHLADNSHFSLNPQFKHGPEWKIAKQEDCKLHQSNIIRHWSRRPFMMLALGTRTKLYRRSSGLCVQGSCGH